MRRRRSFLPRSRPAGAAAAAYGVHAGRSDREVAVACNGDAVYAVGHALGMWRGLPAAAESLRVILVVFGTTGRADQARAGPAPARRARPSATCSPRPASRCSRSRGSSSSSGCGSRTSGSARGAGGRDLRVEPDIPGWFATVTRSCARHRSRAAAQLRGGPGRPLVLVHGDTMTTVLGAVMGRSLRAPVAHIEGGLRSYDLRHPFPEELNRRLTIALARSHYAPGAWAAANLRRGDGRRHRLEHDP